MNPEHDKSQPVVYSHTDFVESISRETGVSPNEITQRQEPESSTETDILAAARQAIAEQGSHGIEALEAQLNLREQYESQQRILWEEAVVDILPSDELGIRGVNGEIYPMPIYEAMLDMIAGKAEMIETKAEQGFTKLLLVPIAMSRDKLRVLYGDRLIDHAHTRNLKGANGDALQLDETMPVYWRDDYYAEANNAIIYYPQEFGPNHQGLTKAELIDETSRNGVAGWEILLIEDLLNLPGDRQGMVIGGRAQLEAGKSPRQYLNTLRNHVSYLGEVGLTPEAWLTYAITHLAEDNQVVDDFFGGGKISFLTGAYLPESKSTPGACWYRSNSRAHFDVYAPSEEGPNWGARTAVRVI